MVAQQLQQQQQQLHQQQQTTTMKHRQYTATLTTTEQTAKHQQQQTGACNTNVFLLCRCLLLRAVLLVGMTTSKAFSLSGMSSIMVPHTHTQHAYRNPTTYIHHQ